MERDVWKDTDRRNHDLNLENLRRTEADIIFFNDKLKMCKDNKEEPENVKDVIKHLSERRQFLDKLKNIDSKISLFLRIRADVKYEDIEHNENLSPKEIRKNVDEFTKEKHEEKHSIHEHEIISQIKKPLDDYEKAKKQNYVKKFLYKRLLKIAWKKHGKIIMKEEFLIKQAKEKFSQSAGTIHELQILEEKRADVIKTLQGLEWITNDHNEEMVINDERLLKSDLRETLSKNELDELDRIKIKNKMYNHIAYVFIGGIVLIGSFFIINVLSVFNF